MVFFNSEFLSLGTPCRPKALSPVMGNLLFLSLFLAFAKIDIEEGGGRKRKQQQKTCELHFQVTIREV